MAKIKPTAAPAWLPDWRDASAYPTTDAPLKEWRWQFLRRLPAYQADFAALSLDGARKIADTTVRAAPGDLSAGPFRAWLQKKAPPERIAQYGAQYLLDPACPHPLGQRQEGARCDVIADLDQQQKAMDEGHYAITFDLRGSIKEQITAARAVLTAEAKKRGFGAGRDTRTHWSRHLRVLDALATGVNGADIAHAFETDYATVEKWPALARKVQIRQTTPTGS
jgi:hypothetical protein